MNKPPHLLKRCFGHSILTTWLLGLSLAIAAPAFADYQPPSTPSSPSTPTTTTGRRGSCSGSEKAKFITLAPQSHVGQTVSTRPRFAWFVPHAQSLPLEFYLYEYRPDANPATKSPQKRQIFKTTLQSAPGVMSLQLPDSEPELEIGSRYQWQVVLLCDPNHPSRAVVANAEIEVVPLPWTLNAALTGVSDRLLRADLYAESGIWYNALSEALQAEGTAAKALQRSLIEDLAQIEQAEGQESRSLQLKQITEVEQE